MLKGASFLICAAAALAPTAARAQTVCGSWKALQAEFAKKYTEVPVSTGVVNGKTSVVVLASPDGASFTVVAVHSNGMACIMATGHGWEPGILPTAGRAS